MVASAAGAVRAAFSRGLEPDPNLPVDEWADEYMVIPKSGGASEYGKYRTSRTPHARAPMRALSPGHWCKRVVVMGASQMLKTQVALNFFGACVHQAPSNFLWILPTGKLAKRASKRIDKTIDAVPVLRERVAQPRSRDSVNTMDTKEYVGGALTIVTSGAAANLSELSCRYVVYDEVDRADANVDGEGDTTALAEARQTTYERNKKSYYPSSPTTKDASTIEALYLKGTQREALADCVHCGQEQTLVFERLQQGDDGRAMYPCIECGAFMYETDKTRMFERGAWTEGVAGDGETESFTISGMFLPYGWFSWLGLLKEYRAAKAKLDEGSDEKMITFYNTRLARSWERKKEQTKAKELEDRAEPYKLGVVPKGGLILVASVDTQPDRFEMKVTAWGEGMEGWIVDYQVISGSPSEQATQDKLDQLLLGRYRHAGGRMLPISATFVDSGGANTQEIYNFCRTRQHRHVFAIKGHSVANKPILGAKPSLQDVNWNGQILPQGVKLWMIGTDTAKDHLAARWKLAAGPGAIHFSEDLPKDYYEQLTAEYCITVWRRGHKVRVWEKKKNDRNEAGDLMVYSLACAYYLGLHKKTAAQWQQVREFVDPDTRDLFLDPAPAAVDTSTDGEGPAAAPQPTTPAQTRTEPWIPSLKPTAPPSPTRRQAGRQW
jgi:phage terminase large subunit GpA-like protein